MKGRRDRTSKIGDTPNIILGDPLALKSLENFLTNLLHHIVVLNLPSDFIPIHGQRAGNPESSQLT